MKTEMTISVRPPRHVYFVPDNDLNRFVDVASWCCTQWGGINNLIVPANADTGLTARDSHFSPNLSAPIFAEFLSWRKPDIYVDAVTRLDEAADPNDLSKVKWEYSGKPLYWWDYFTMPGIDECLHPLSILPENSNFERTPTHEERLLSSYIGLPTLFIPANLLVAPITDFDQTVITTAFGKIMEEQRADYERSFVLKPWPMYVPSLFLSSQFEDDPSSSVINLTSRELSNFGSSPALFHPYFDVVVDLTP
jgi:hypothetical protein